MKVLMHVLVMDNNHVKHKKIKVTSENIYIQVMNFGYICTMTLTSEILPLVKA